jgi:MFS transporter, BCD family, chlorophyll transporter
MDSNLSEIPLQTHLPPKISLGVILRLGLFQIGLGIMSVLLFGLLNRIMIKELQIPATLTSLVIAVTLFVAPTRVWFGHLSDVKPLFGMHRTGYVWSGAVSFALLAFGAVQVIWQMAISLYQTGWSGTTVGWIGLLIVMFGLYGVAIGAASTPFTTLLVDITDEEERSKVVSIDWAMLLGGTIVGAITIGILLKPLVTNPLFATVKAQAQNQTINAAGFLQLTDTLRGFLNPLYVVVPLIVVVLSLVATWGVEHKYSRYKNRLDCSGGESMGFKKAWVVLSASRQTKFFFSFLLAMTLGLFLQDPILEPFGGDIFNLAPGATAMLNAFWGTGTVIGILASGLWLTPRVGKRQTTKLGCQAVVISLVLVVLAGMSENADVLKVVLLLFGLASGTTTTGALTLMLDLTAVETAGTFIGAWGLAQSWSRGFATLIGGAMLDIGKLLFGKNLLFAYGAVFALQAIAMVVAIQLLERVNVQEFRASAKETITAVIANDRD